MSDSLGPIEGRTFADLEVPFRAVATDIATGARVELVDGDEAAFKITTSDDLERARVPGRVSEPLPVDDCQPGFNGGEPDRRPQPDPGHGLRGGNLQHDPRPNPAAGGHGHAGASQPATPDGAGPAQVIERPL